MTVLAGFLAQAQQAKEPATAAQNPPGSAGAGRVFTLEECLSTALQNNHRRPASRFAVAAAQAQHRQALAGYWPHVFAKGGYQRMDESPNFIFPAGTMQIPAQTITTSPQQFPIPEQDIKLMDENSFVASLNAVWLLYDGGMRRGYREQSQAGIKAAEGSVRTTRSGFFPKLAVTGELHKWWNDYDAGIATTRNKEGWTVGVGLELPLFEGFLTRAKVSESKARLHQINEQKLLLQEGIGLMVKDIFPGLSAAVKADQATGDAMKSAEENRDLNTRAYQNELVETDKVIRAQLVEALMTAQHLKTRYDHLALQSQLNLVVGTEIWKQLKMNP